MPCGGCKYPGWFGPHEWCRHPDYLEPIEPARKFAIIAAGGRCPSFVEWEAKVMPGSEPPWPMPVVMRQLIAVIAVYVPIEYKNDEMSAKNDSK